MDQDQNVDQLTENILRVVHNMELALMAVNGYIDILTPDKSSELHEGAKQSTKALETVINNLVFALRAYRNTESTDISLNQCVKSAVELIRSNDTFQGKAKFSFVFDDNDMIHAVPMDVMERLVEFISDEATRVLGNGEYTMTLVTARESECMNVRINGSETAFPNSRA